MTKITAYKAFNADWTCRDFQYEVGKTYSLDTEAKLCESGFHACERPLDIFYYYPPTGQIAEVEMSDVSEETHDDDSKRASKTIFIKAALNIAGLVSAQFAYVVSHCDPTKTSHSKTDQSASSATGDQSASSATGDRSASSATGAQSASSATGYRSASSATGYQSASSATGDNAIAAAFGLESKAKAGETGIVVVAWWDEESKRKRLTVSYVGENGIKPDVFYTANNAGELEEVKA